MNVIHTVKRSSAFRPTAPYGTNTGRYKFSSNSLDHRD